MRRPLKSLHTLTASLTEIAQKGPILAIQSHEKIANGDAYRIVASHNPGEFTEADFADSVRRTFEGKLSLVECSVNRVLDGNQPVTTLLVVANAESKDYTPETTKGMQVVTANMFMDESDNMWKVVGDEQNRRLVQMSNDNLDEILASRMARKVVHASYTPDVKVGNGDYIHYYEPKLGRVTAGFTMNVAEVGQVVVERSTGAPYKVEAAQIVDTIPSKFLSEEFRVDIPRHLTLAELTGTMASAHMDYMRKLYAGTPYFAKLEKLVAQKKSNGGNAIINMRKDG